jgi:signal peptide peptidase SppA
MSDTQNIPLTSLPSMSGAWLMTRDRVNEFAARIRAVVAQPMPSQQPKEDPGYSVADGVARIEIIGTLVKYGSPAKWIDDLLGICSTQRLTEYLARAMADSSVRSIVLELDTCGGQVAGTTQFAEAVAAANVSKPVDAIVSDACHSGGIWIASQCRSIAANASAFIGSIGVVSILVDDEKFWSDLGVRLVVVSTGTHKGLGMNGSVPPELVEDVKRENSGLYEQFIATVAKGRKMKLEAVRALADGRSWIAAEAQAKGLIDTIVGPASSSLQSATVPAVRLSGKSRSELSAAYRTGTAAEKAAATAEMAVLCGMTATDVRGVWDAQSLPTTSTTPNSPTTTTHGDDNMSKSKDLPPIDMVEAQELAGREWDTNPAVRVGWLSKKNYVTVRSQQLAGRLKIGGANALPAAPLVPRTVAPVSTSASGDDRTEEVIEVKGRKYLRTSYGGGRSVNIKSLRD